MTKARILGLGFGLILILGAFSVVLWQGMNMPTLNTAFAQGAATATPAADTTATPTPAQQQPQQQPQQQAQIGDSFWTLLAGKLGVNVDDLKSKAVEARKEMIDQAVKDGRITQAEADAIKQRIASNNIIAPIPLGRGFRGNGNGNGNGQNQPGRGPFGAGPGPFRGHGFQGGGFGPGMGMLGGNLAELDAVAKALKLDSKTLIQQLSQGKTLADVAKAQSVDEATVKQAIIDARKAQIDQALSLGLISEVQANALKARLTPDNIDLSRKFFAPFHAMPGQKQSSDLAPNGQGSQSFGFAPDDPNAQDQFTFPSDGQFTLPGDVQTQ